MKSIRFLIFLKPLFFIQKILFPTLCISFSLFLNIFNPFQSKIYHFYITHHLLYNFFILYAFLFQFVCYNVHMKLIRTLEVSEDEFYDYLESDLVANIQQCEGKDVSVRDIKKGLKYSIHDKKANVRTDVTILEYKRGDYYKARVKSPADTITISYKTEPDEKGLKVIFHQLIDSFENSRQNKVMRLFSEGVYFGRMSDALQNIQKKIIERRTTVEENK